MTAYYNEFDPNAAAWLRELIAEGHIANGVVDTRSIEDVTPNDLNGFAQCHFFAGIGGWSLALRMAGWPDDRSIWTGSCPCQPFSSAGQGKGFADERHLWPAFYWLISQCKPNIVFGEQVASALPWVDLVQADLEAENYTFGKSILGAHSVGAPHIRQRLYWVAHDNSSRRSPGRQGGTTLGYGQTAAPDCSLGELAHGGGQRRKRGPDTQGPTSQNTSERGEGMSDAERSCHLGELAYGGGAGLEVLGEQQARRQQPAVERGRQAGQLGHASGGGSGRDSGALPGEESGTQRGVRSELDQSELTSILGELEHTASDGREQWRPGADGRGAVGAWDNADWLPCRDGKSRPVETGTFPLAHGIPGRVGLLRGYGNAIVPEVAAKFIEAFDSLRRRIGQRPI